MSDTPMNTPNETSSSRTKVARPDLFHGDRHKLEDWILQFDLFFRFEDEKVDPTDRGLLMASYMRGTAATWIKPYLNKYMDDNDDDDDIERMFEDHPTFKDKLRQQFGVINEESKADRAIQQLKQTQSVADYASVFQGHALKTDWDDKALRVMYRQGLKERVKEELMRSGVAINNLQDLIRESIRIDNALYELQQEIRPVRANQSVQRTKGRFFKKKPGYRTTPGGIVPSAGNNWHDPDAMQLDNINKGKSFGRNDKKKPYNKKEITCYNCDKKGHMARDCHSKNKVVRQLNVIHKAVPTERHETWNVISKPTIEINTQESVLGLDNLTLVESDSEEEPTSEYDMLEDESKNLEATEIDQTKFGKMATFEEVNRPSTPYVQEEEFYKLAGQINQLLRHLNKADIEYAYEEPSIMAAMRQDFYRLSLEVQRNKENVSTEILEFLPTTWELSWIEDAIRSWEEPTLPISEEEKQEIYDELCQTRNDWKTFQHGHKRKAKDISRSKEYDYWMDPRNPEHEKLSWVTCIHDHCRVHYSDKSGSGWFPEETKRSYRCKWQFFDCKNDLCPIHLWDKREKTYFPGHDNPEEIDQMQTVWLKEYDEGDAWEYLIKLQVKLEGRWMKALVDSGSQANYVSAHAASSAGLKPLRKQEAYPLHVANGEPMPGEQEITHEVRQVTLNIQGHQEKIDLDVFGLATHDIILGLPWLREHNPRIDWKSKTFSFECCGTDATTSQPTHCQSTMVDERKLNNIAKKKRASTKDGLKKQGSDSADAGTEPPGRQTRVLEKRATPEIPEEYKEFEHLFREVADEQALPKHQPWDHKIVLQEGKKPTFGPIYGLSEKELSTLRDYIKTSLAKKYIRPSQSPAGYPIMFVPKKDGKLRLCVDYRKLNDITIKNRYPLPNITELRDRLSRAKIFTALDLRDGYHLIRIAKGEEWKTAFRSRYGHYEYTVMPFGLTNAPATFQELINNVLRAHLDIFVIAYLDDILVYSETLEDHVEHVKTVLRALEQFNLRLKPEKCEFHKTKVNFLGYVVGADGVQMSEEKIQVIKDWPTPTTVVQIQSFLGFLNFNRQFIKDFSDIAIPLTKLTRKDVPFKWSKEAENAFQTLKKASIEPPCFRIFQAGHPLRFETDASDLALGGCASQLHEGKWHPIAYYSRKFSGPEERYDVHDKELLAIVACLQHWRVYAESCSELTIYTDHKNLVNFTTTKVLNRRQVRWSELLGQYKFKIVYTPGKENGRADALSHSPQQSIKWVLEGSDWID
ncbi:reverse transcriptase [Pyrenophora tritici-repentis]|nr:reverse transcriptase [Pyrenophora tritici-repentis]